MSWLIIGSTAAYHWFPDLRAPSDIDLLTPAKISGSKAGVCIVDSQWHSSAEFLIEQNTDKVFADPDLLFTLKVSHAEWNINWQKTMFDIGALQDRGCKLLPEQYKRLVDTWKIVHGKKRVNMKQKVTEFFKDAVSRKYDHEELHQLVAFNGAPMHERLRTDHSTAWCSETLFNALTPDEKAETALEEILATAIERSKLTYTSSRVTQVQAVMKAYQQLVTSMTTGWFALFLILNHRDLLHTRKPKWINQLNSALLNVKS